MTEKTYPCEPLPKEREPVLPKNPPHEVLKEPNKSAQGIGLGLGQPLIDEP